ncbi:MAG: hypothetical protein K0V04_29250, partial [Deltaproteobacteria bacterium]|nr:hypothetical protein [Deltaproteobacteria bacterium]
ELRERMSRATTRAQMLRIFDALQNSLLDLHLRFRPASSDPRRVGLPVSLTLGGSPGAWRVIVSKVPSDLSDRMTAGDIVVSIDGVETAALLHEHRFASSFNQLRPNVQGVVRALGQRSAVLWPELIGHTAAVEVQRQAGGQRSVVELPWAVVDSQSRGLDEGLEPGLECDQVPPRAYGPYQLTAVGANVCIYTSDRKPYSRYPIVRHHGFLYEGRGGGGRRLARIDHTLISTTLAQQRKTKGVLLDLRDNHGGNNPHVFLDWWAPAPYDNTTVVVRLHQSLADRDDGSLDRMLWSTTRANEYRARVARGETVWAHPFLCPDEACTEGGRMTPAHPVTRAPVALMVGPWCISSCDTFAKVFSANRFGPLVGEPTAAAYTVNRMPIELVLPGGEQLGTFELAVSRSRIGADGDWIEAVPLPIDREVPETFANRAEHDRLMVDAAIEALGTYPRR